MPVTPHPITVTVKDTDNSTAKENAKVYLRNTTKKTTSDEALTNSSGLAIIDLANMGLGAGQTLEYETGDKILIITYWGANHDAVMYTVTGSSKAQTLYLNPVPHQKPRSNEEFTVESILTILTAETGGTVRWCKVYAVDDGQLLAWIETPSNDSRYPRYERLKASGGFVIQRENQALVVTVELK